jgi:hypothetical protein
MKINFRKISAIMSSALMIGMSAGVAAAANYPAPFVVGSSADVAIVYGTGTGVSTLDAIQAGNIQTDLQSRLSGTSGGTSASVDGEAVTLNAGSTKIWLNTSLNTAYTTLTKTDLPTVLGEYTFSGNVDSKLTSTITVGSTNKVTFAKQPSSNDDPVIGIAMSTNSSLPLYTAGITMPAIAFNDSDSEGETIELFGREFVVSTATDATSLVLFSSAEEVALSVGGTNPSSQTVTVDGTTYTVELVTGSSTTSATIAVNGESKAITAGQSKKINGLDVALKSVTESTALSKIDATILVGSNKLTFTNGTQVTQGSEDDPIDGTFVLFNSGAAGATTATLTGLSVAVYAPTSSDDAVLEGETFSDPVFGSFKVDFTGLNVPFDSSDRETIKIDKAGDKGMSLTMTEADGNTATFDFIYNASGSTFLGDSNSDKIYLQEGTALGENDYTVVGNEDYGHLIQVTRIYNSTTSDYSKDSVTFKDVITGDTYSMDATKEGAGRLTLDGRQYTLAYTGTGDSGAVTITYPTSDSSNTEYVVLPTIETSKGALVMLYEPQNITLSNDTGIKIPDGDGYQTFTFTEVETGDYSIGDGTATPAIINTTNSVGLMNTTLTVGSLRFYLNATDTDVVTLTLLNPSDSTTEISTPGIVLIEAKDDLSRYEVIAAYTDASAGTSGDPVGIETVASSSPTWYSETQQTDSDIVESVTWYGTHISEDSNTASQKVVTFSYPDEQVYANIYFAEDGAVITPGSSGSTATPLGEVLVKDTEVSSVSTKNLIIVGGSCINSAAATVLGGAYCGSSFTDATGVGSGQFLIKGVSGSSVTSKLALVVAGYDVADTVNAATYLRNQPVDTSKEYLGTSSTTATLVTTTA